MNIEKAPTPAWLNIQKKPKDDIAITDDTLEPDGVGANAGVTHTTARISQVVQDHYLWGLP
jgi:hypothetical protein